MLRTLPLVVLVTVLGASTGCPARAAELKVVVTSKPVHSLVAAVMDGAGTPVLLVEGQASPHTFSLKPSGARAINAAEVFIRVCEAIEPFTGRIAAALAAGVTLVTLADTPGLTLLDKRTGATFEGHSHGGHEHHGGHDDDDDDQHGGKDGHIWLDPVNARLMAAQIAAVLSEKDPAHKEIFAANASRFAARVDALSAEISGQMAPLRGRPFVVFHDAYQYFEHRFGVAAVGSVTVSPNVQPSAKRLAALRGRIAKLDAACVFAEPLFQPKLVAAVTEGTRARAGTLDPEGISLEPGPDLYFTLMRTLAANLLSCLKPAP